MFSYKKKGFIGKIIFIIVILLFSLGTMIYINLSKDSFEVSAGNVVINLDYNSTPKENPADDKPIIEEEISIIGRDKNVTNNSYDNTNTSYGDANVTFKNISLENQQ